MYTSIRVLLINCNTDPPPHFLQSGRWSVESGQVPRVVAQLEKDIAHEVLSHTDIDDVHDVRHHVENCDAREGEQPMHEAVVLAPRGRVDPHVPYTS